MHLKLFQYGICTGSFNLQVMDEKETIITCILQLSKQVQLSLIFSNYISSMKLPWVTELLVETESEPGNWLQSSHPQPRLIKHFRR